MSPSVSFLPSRPTPKLKVRYDRLPAWRSHAVLIVAGLLSTSAVHLFPPPYHPQVIFASHCRDTKDRMVEPILPPCHVLISFCA